MVTTTSYEYTYGVHVFPLSRLIFNLNHNEALSYNRNISHVRYHIPGSFVSIVYSCLLFTTIVPVQYFLRDQMTIGCSVITCSKLT